jgi:hypothetical protein
MAWEWVAPVVTGAVGVTGMVITLLAGKQARDAARVDAREAREQQRLETAYVSLLDMAERAGQHVQMMCPVVDTRQPLPEMPSYAEQARTYALVGAVASAEMRKRIAAWLDVIHQATTTAGLIPEIEADPWRYQGITENQRLKLRELQRHEREAHEALREQAAVELGHRSESRQR